MNNPVNQVPYLRASRDFTGDDLPEIMDKAYVDTAIAINDRTIGLFPVGRSAVTGEKWYVNDNKQQQTLRQAYPFSSATDFDHGLTFENLSQISRMWGTYTDGTNWYGLVPTSSTSIAGQLGFYLSPTQVVFTPDAGAPTPTDGLIVIEWISYP